MSHNISGNRLALHNEPAWHPLGTVFTDPIDASGAVKIADGEFMLYTCPLQVQLPDGSYMPIDQSVAIMREPLHDDPSWAFFGIAGKDYAMYQNADLARLLDPLTEEWPVETLGFLGHGETMFATLKAKTLDINGEQLDQYFLVADTRDGTASLHIAYTPIRVVCQNTLRTGLAQSTVSVAVPHFGGTFKRDVEFYMATAAKMQEAADKTVDAFNLLMQNRLMPDEFDKIAAAAFPIPTIPRRITMSNGMELTEDMAALVEQSRDEYQRSTLKAFLNRQATGETYQKFNDEYPKLAETAWAAVNAVVEHIDHAEVRGNRVARSRSIMFGQAGLAKDRAFKEAMDICLN